MSITILIPTPLRPSVDNNETLEITQSGSVSQLVTHIISLYPKVKPYLMDDEGELRKFVNFYINDTDIRDLNEGDTLLNDGDTLSIVPAIAGGNA